jgi:uncharacterized membrane protein YeaQ/YmgE (transglycosylase-associated protein family)
MIGMGFGAFLTLFVISFIAAAVIHYGFHYRFLNGIDGFFTKWIFGWLGAWIASPVLGHWFAGFAIGGQYIVPAFLGAFSTAFLIAAVAKAMARARSASAESPEMVAQHAGVSTRVTPETRVA